MVDADALKQLMEALDKLLGKSSDDDSDDDQDDNDAAQKHKKKGKSLTVISISKGKPGALAIPKVAKEKRDNYE